MNPNHIVILTGAGISEESGLPTFRGKDGLWENRRLEEIATIEALEAHPADVIRFYNERRQALRKVEPNAAHRALVELESKFEVSIITQNIDDLHERAGSRSVLHLHGQLRYATSMVDPDYRLHLGDDDIQPGQTCPRGGQLRPHVVLFGESVPNFTKAIELCEQADYFLVIGTSLNVYPAAALIDHPPANCPCFLIDPNASSILNSQFPNSHFPIINSPFSNPNSSRNFHRIAAPATTGVPKLVNALLREHFDMDN